MSHRKAQRSMSGEAGARRASCAASPPLASAALKTLPPCVLPSRLPPTRDSQLPASLANAASDEGLGREATSLSRAQTLHATGVVAAPAAAGACACAEAAAPSAAAAEAAAAPVRLGVASAPRPRAKVPMCHAYAAASGAFPRSCRGATRSNSGESENVGRVRVRRALGRLRTSRSCLSTSMDSVMSSALLAALEARVRSGTLGARRPRRKLSAAARAKAHTRRLRSHASTVRPMLCQPHHAKDDTKRPKPATSTARPRAQSSRNCRPSPSASASRYDWSSPAKRKSQTNRKG